MLDGSIDRIHQAMGHAAWIYHLGNLAGLGA